MVLANRITDIQTVINYKVPCSLESEKAESLTREVLPFAQNDSPERTPLTPLIPFEVFGRTNSLV